MIGRDYGGEAGMETWEGVGAVKLTKQVDTWDPFVKTNRMVCHK